MTDEMADAKMRAFCESVGELVLWASAIDAQLTKAVIRICSLTETPMLDPIVAELSARTKSEILRVRSRYVETVDWRSGITRWVSKADRVMSYRNIVAHHQVGVRDGRLILHSAQVRKVLKSIKGMKPMPAKSHDDVTRWVGDARAAYGQGQNVLDNLERVSRELAKRK